MKFWLRKNSNYLFATFVFVSILLFFYEVHPFVLFDADDWKDMAELRPVAFPKWHDWNPSKVLPETMMALVGYIGAYVFVPLVGDYLRGISLVVAVVVSSFITAYILLLKDVLNRHFAVTRGQATVIAFLFLLFHFLIFKNNVDGNYYLFSTLNMNCVFHYIIPFLLNASLVLYFMSRDIHGNYHFTENRTQSAFLIFAIYLALYSNILLSIAFIAYIAGNILKGILSQKSFSWGRFKQYIKQNKLYTGIIIAWLISLLFEANGGRAHDIETNSLLTSLLQTTAAFNWIFLQGQKGLNIMYAVFVLIVFPALWQHHRKKQVRDIEADTYYSYFMKLGLFCLFFWLLFEIPVCAKANATYISRPDVLAGFFFFVFLMIAVSMAYLLKQFPNLLLIFPIIFFIIFCRTVNGKMGYLPSTYDHLPEQTCYAISNDLISQFQQADRMGSDEFDLHVPKWNTGDNWPQPEYITHRMEEQLYSHSMISHHMKVHLVIDKHMNDVYHVEK